MSDSLLAIHNSTEHGCSGVVHYINGQQENFSAIAWDCWMSSSESERDLIAKITAKVMLTEGIPVDALPYTASGSSRTEFVLIKRGKDFVVSSIVSEDNE